MRSSGSGTLAWGRDCSRKCNLAALHSGPRRRTPVNAGNWGGLEASAERCIKISDFGALEQARLIDGGRFFAA